jgi:iron complex outermembrane receptor protein
MSSNVLLYGKATKGYKAGGFNYASPRMSGLTFQPERVMSYEIGAKSDLRVGNVPVRFNISAYQLNYKSIQRAQGDNVPNGCPGSGDPFCNTTGLDQGAITYNIGKARLRGVEVETAVRPLAGFDLSASYSYTKGKYLDYTIAVPADPVSGPQVVSKLTCAGRVPIPQGVNAPVTLIDLSCAPFPFTPKHQVSITARYEHKLAADAGAIVATVTYSHASRAWSAPTSLPGAVDGYVDSYDVVNASIDWNGMLGTPIDARVFVTNLTNTTYRISNTAGDDGSLGFSTAIYNEPRMYGLSLRYRFGE